MREGSYTQIQKGMQVLGRDGSTIGGVDEVIVDEGSGIFIGLAVRPNLFTHPLLLPGDQIDRLHDGTVYTEAAAAELHPYNTPAERHHDTAEAFADVGR